MVSDLFYMYDVVHNLFEHDWHESGVEKPTSGRFENATICLQSRCQFVREYAAQRGNVESTDAV